MRRRAHKIRLAVGIGRLLLTLGQMAAQPSRADDFHIRWGSAWEQKKASESPFYPGQESASRGLQLQGYTAVL